MSRIRSPLYSSQKDRSAAYEGVQVASEVVGTEASPLGTTSASATLRVQKKHLNTSHNQHCMEKVGSTDYTVSPNGKPSFPGILEEVMDWSEARDFRALPEKVARA